MTRALELDDAPCKTCNGDGVVFEDKFSHAIGHYTVDVACPDCDVAEGIRARDQAVAELAAELRHDQELFG